MKLLIIRNDNIGDLVCTTPLLEVLRSAYPEATIDLLGNGYNIEILRYDPRVSRLWSYNKAGHTKNVWKKIKAWIGKVALLWRLRQEQYDAVILATSVFNKRSTTLARTIRPKVIYGAVLEKTSLKHLPCSYHSVKIDSSIPHVLQVLTYARALGLELPFPKAMHLYLSLEEKEQALQEKSLILKSENKPIIGIQLSARRPLQRWPFKQWEELITALLPYGHIRLFWSPGASKFSPHPGDDLLAEQLQNAFPENTLLAQPTLNLRSLMVSVSICNLFVGADGGAMHLAAALNVPTVTLFGDVNPAVWAPYSEQGTTLKSPSENLADLDPHVVVEKIKKQLQS